MKCVGILMETTQIKARQCDAMLSVIEHYNIKKVKTDKDRKELIGRLNHIKKRTEQELMYRGM